MLEEEKLLNLFETIAININFILSVLFVFAKLSVNLL